MFKLNNKVISIDNEYTSEEGITYPNLRNPEVRELLGVIELPDPEFYDQRFYWDVNIPKDLNQLKDQWISQSKENANKELSQTDWMIIRKAERNIDIPEDIVANRQSIINKCSDLEIQIQETTTVEELIAVLFPQAAEE